MRKVQGTEIRGTTYHFNFSHKAAPKGRCRGSIGTSDPDIAKTRVAEKTLELDNKLDGNLCTATWEYAVALYVDFKDQNRSIEDAKQRLAWITSIIRKHYPEGDKVLLTKLDSDFITELTRASKKVWVVTRKDTRSAGSTNLYLSTLRATLNLAVKKTSNYHITDIPEIEDIDVVDRPERFLTREEAALVLNELRGSVVRHIYDMVRFSLATGLRQHNVTHLPWRDVDLSRRQVTIRKHTAKGKKAFNIPLSKKAVAVLIERRGLHDEFVFANLSGKVVTQIASTNGPFKKALRKNGLDWCRWHDLRHAWASWHLDDVGGCTPLHVLQQLGAWSNIKVVIETYGHLAQSTVANFADNADMDGDWEEKPRLVAIK